MSKIVLLFSQNIEAATREIQALDGHVTQQFTGQVFEALLPDPVDPESLKNSQAVPPGELDEVSRRVVDAWQLKEARLKKAEGSLEKEEILSWGTPGYQPPISVKNPPDTGEADSLEKKTPRLTGAPANLFLKGTVSVGMVIVSGPGSLNFSPGEKKEVVSGVMDGLGFLAAAEPCAKVTFVMDYQYVDIDVPPLSSNCGDGIEPCESVWRDPALQKLGFPTGFQGSEMYVDHLVKAYHTNSGFVLYFTKYPQFWFAYEYSGLVISMQYPFDGWKPGQVNKILAHETCHIFGAQDEYNSSITKCVCGVPSGYYGVPGNNCINCPGPHVECLMGENTLSLCKWSRGQLGWPVLLLGPNASYGSGGQNSIAMDDQGNCAEVHSADDKLWYRVGRINSNDQTISWGTNESYDTSGTRPNITMDNHGNCVEIRVFGDYLYYRVGKIDFNFQNISWGQSKYYDRGNFNAISMDNNGNCVEVHGYDGALYYRVGRIQFNVKDIVWGPSAWYDTSGPNAIAMDDSGNCVEVHAGADKLWYHVGKIDFQSQTIAWGVTTHYDWGMPASIAMDNNGNCLEVHAADGRTWYRVGRVDFGARSIAWSKITEPYDWGWYCTIAMDNNRNCVEVHSEDGGLWCHTGRIVPV